MVRTLRGGAHTAPRVGHECALGLGIGPYHDLGRSLLSVAGAPLAVVASGHPAVSAAGAAILRAGGNAFDASVAAGFASTIAEPALTSLGGGGFLLAYEATSGKATAFDFFVDTPGRGRTTAALEPHFMPITIHFTESDQIFNAGRGSVAVPGTLKGLLHVHERLGRLPLQDVVEPAATLAREGTRLNQHQAHFLEILNPILCLTPHSRQLFSRDGQLFAAGDLWRNPGLAQFLETLGRDRGASFYEGTLAEQIDREMQEGGHLTAEDLASYQVIERTPIEVDYRGHRVLTNPPPSFGGSLLTLSLKLLESQPLAELQWGSEEHLALLVTLQMEVDRLRGTGCLSSPGSTPEGASQSIQRLRRAVRGTTHICVADAEGNVGSMTNSNGEGSGFVAAETGIMLNNMMGEDDLHPEGFHASPPGERVASMMSPSLVLYDDRPRLALGSGGSKRIRCAILQTITQIIDFERDLETAIAAPRIHWDGQTLQIEPGFPQQTVEGLARRWPVKLWQACDVYFGGVHALVPGQSGAADFRRGGAVEIVG